jgi:hypothetical protein
MEIDGKVNGQLSNYVSSIAEMYQDNPFHNFEHTRVMWRCPWSSF